MNMIKRAFLYVIRKRKKTLTIFLLLLVIATMTLSAVAIKEATKTAQLNVREALGGSFTLNQNTNDASKWVKRQVSGYGYQQYYGGEPLTKELAENICMEVDGIKGYNASYGSYVVMKNILGKNLELIETDTEQDAISSALSSFGDFNQTVTTLGSTNTAYDSYFTNGFIKLYDGRHITSEDTNVAIINKELAENNNLAVGDKLILSQAEYKAAMSGINIDDTKTEVEIIGLFEIMGKASSSFSNWSMDNTLFTTFEAIKQVRPEIGDESYEHIKFYVKDPAKLDEIIERVKILDGIDWTDFVIDVDTSEVDLVLEPLQNMNTLITLLIIIVIVIGAVILYLILSSRIKERIHESGILLSIGVSKISITLQYITELVLIAVLAFGLSYISSSIIAQNVGNKILDYSLSDGIAKPDDKNGNSYDGITVLNTDDLAPQFDTKTELTVINVNVNTQTLAILYIIGLIIILLSVSFAAVPILRLKPREILAKYE